MSIESDIRRSCEDAGEVYYRSVAKADSTIRILDKTGKDLGRAPEISDSEYHFAFVVYDRALPAGPELELLLAIMGHDLLTHGRLRDKALEEFGFEEKRKTALPEILIDIASLHEKKDAGMFKLLEKYGIPALQPVNISGKVMLGCDLDTLIERISSLLVLVRHVPFDEGTKAHGIVREMEAGVDVELFGDNGELKRRIVCRDWLSAAEYFAIEYVSKNYDSNITTNYERYCRCGKRLEGKQRLYCSDTCKNTAKTQRYRNRKKSAVSVCSACKRRLEEGDDVCRLDGKLYCADCVYASWYEMQDGKLESFQKNV